MLGVRDMKRSIEFYENVLGFSAKAVMPDREYPKYAKFTRFGTEILVQPLGLMREGLIENFRFPKESEPGLGVVHYVEFPDYEDIDAYYEELKGKEIAIVKELSDRSWGKRDFMVADPDGHFISFSKQKDDAAKCLSCGMPIVKDEEHAKGDSAIPFCKHCTDADGKLKPFEQVVEGMKGFLVSGGMAPDEAERKARDGLRKMEAWKST